MFSSGGPMGLLKCNGGVKLFLDTQFRFMFHYKRASSINNWRSLFDYSRMINIVGVYVAEQTGLSNKWRSMAEDEFCLLSVAV